MNLPISSMTTAEKLAAMEQLWTSLQSPGDCDVPEWHEQVLAEHAHRLENGETTFSSLEELQSRLGKRQ